METNIYTTAYLSLGYQCRQFLKTDHTLSMNYLLLVRHCNEIPGHILLFVCSMYSVL